MSTTENHALKMFQLYLECYCHPRWQSGAKPYWGTMDDFENFLEELSFSGADNHYHELIEAYDDYQKHGKANYAMAHGTYPFATPVEVICRRELDHYSDIVWHHFSLSESVRVFSASDIYGVECLIKTDKEYIRCVKLSFNDLEMNMPSIGWVDVDNRLNGFPGAFSWNGYDCHNMNLFIAIEHYTHNEFRQAMRDFRNDDIEKLHLGVAMNDVIGPQ